MSSRIPIGYLISFVLLISSGCGQNDHPPLTDVTGKITLDGKPLAGANVQFDPGDIRPATGVTDQEGNYTLKFVPGTPGAPIGKNIVRIYPKSSDASGNNLPESEIVRIPDKYNENSELTALVTEEGPNTFNFALKSQ